MSEFNLDFLNQLGEKWLEAKVQRMRNLLKIAYPDEALYREIMLSLGYPKNKVQFLELALILPYREIKELREKEAIEKALLYRAGFVDSKEGLPNTFDFSLRMNKTLWNYKGIRPANYPDRRIKGIVHLLSNASSIGLTNYFIIRIQEAKAKLFSAQNKEQELNKKQAKSFVEKVMDFTGIGINRKREMFFNIIMPFYIACFEKENPEMVKFLNAIFLYHPPLAENSITKKFKSIVGEVVYSELNISTKTYFGIHYYLKEVNKKR